MIHHNDPFVAMTSTIERDPVCVRVSALSGGSLTLPENLFVTDPEPGKFTTVPSLCFLIEHRTGAETEQPTRIVLDLGLKRDLDAYEPAMRSHISNRQPITTFPDVAESLRRGGLDPANDIDVVMYTHMHWDHVGTPSDFPGSTFIVGSGTLHLLEHGAVPHYPPEMFNPNMLDRKRTTELPAVREEDRTYATTMNQAHYEWKPFFGLPAVVDFFGDGSLLVVDSPGHLRGHINLLLRVEPHRYVFLGGDCCHDVRILQGSKGIALYDDGHGQLRSVHMDTEVATDTISMIKKFLERRFKDNGTLISLETVIAHDRGWMEANEHRFFPGWM